MPQRLLEEFTEAKNNLQSGINDYGPFLRPDIYETLQRMVTFADKERNRPSSMVPGRGGLALLSDLADEFGTLRRQLFKAIVERLEELSQYQRPDEAADE